MRRYLTFIFLTLFLVACQAMNGSTSQPTAIDEKAVWTSVAATLYVGLTETATGATRMPAITPTSTANPTNTPLPVRIPTTEPTKVSSVLQPALIIQPSDSFGGHTAQKITGWKYGFESFEWIGADHLLLNAFVDETGLSFGIIYPAVLNLSTKKIWLPELTPETLTSNGLLFHYKPYWSDKLHRLISNNILSSGEMVIELYDLNGKLVKSYPGRLTSVSPSRTKIMVDKGTWFDLTTGKMVNFAWDWTMADGTSRNVIWSEDEMSVFSCCYLYGNARTGENFRFEISDFYLDSPFGRWVLNDTYLIPECCSGHGNSHFVAAFSPVNKTLLNVNDLAGIPQLLSDKNLNSCTSWSTSPDKRHVWITCLNGSYLVDLGTFGLQAYLGHSYYWDSDVSWSTNGKHAFISGLDKNTFAAYIISIDNKKLSPITNGYDRCKWHPAKDEMICLSYDSQTILLLDARTNTSIQKLKFPLGIFKLVWSPGLKRVAILAGDNSLWTVEYPGMDKIEQLTSALPTPIATPLGMKPGLDNVTWFSKDISPATSNWAASDIRNIIWSPDSTSLAFIEGQNIYIIDAQTKP